VTEELPVHVSRKEIHGIDVPGSFSVDGSFDAVFINHGRSVHVHLHLDDALSAVASIDAGNHYVEGESQRAVRVTVDEDRIPEDGVAGKIKVVAAYGAKTRWVDVTVSPPSDDEEAIEVDESLGEPQPREDDRTQTPEFSPEIAVAILAVVALLIAFFAVIFIRDAFVVVGALAVVVGVVGAVYLLMQ
jgi:hypothetical protein